MNVRESINPVYSRAFLERVAAAYKTDPAAALVVTPQLHLIKDESFEPDPSRSAADYAAVEADFTDYAASAITLSAPVNLGPDVVGPTANNSFLITTDPVVTENTIYGYWIEDATEVICGEMFAEGQEVTMGSPGDQLVVISALPIQAWQSVEGSI